MASDIWLRTILIVRKETRCRHICYSFRLIARVILYASFHRQDNTYHGLCYTNRGSLAGTRNSSMKDRSDDPTGHERTLLPRSYISLSGAGSVLLEHASLKITPIIVPAKMSVTNELVSDILHFVPVTNFVNFFQVKLIYSILRTE